MTAELKRAFRWRSIFFPCLSCVRHLILPLLMPLPSSTTQRRGPEARAAWRSTGQSVIQQQGAILHRNGPTLPSASLSIKSSRRRRKGGTRMSPFLNVLWANDWFMTTATELTSFLRLYLLWYVTTHPPGSYLPKSHLMWRLHMRSEWCHNTQQRKMLQRMMTCFHFFFKVKVTFESIFWVIKSLQIYSHNLFEARWQKTRHIYYFYFFTLKRHNWNRLWKVGEITEKGRE